MSQLDLDTIVVRVLKGAGTFGVDLRSLYRSKKPSNGLTVLFISVSTHINGQMSQRLTRVHFERNLLHRLSTYAGLHVRKAAVAKIGHVLLRAKAS